MMYQAFKNIFKKSHLSSFAIFLVSIALVTQMGTPPAYAAIDCTIPIDDVSQDPVGIVCPFVKAINVLLYAAGGVFIIMLIISAIKYATSLGDPKGHMGAFNTALYGVIGLGVILGFFVILQVSLNAFGINANFASLNVYVALQNSICNLLTNSSANGLPIVSNIQWCP